MLYKINMENIQIPDFYTLEIEKYVHNIINFYNNIKKDDPRFILEEFINYLLNIFNVSIYDFKKQILDYWDDYEEEDITPSNKFFNIFSCFIVLSVYDKIDIKNKNIILNKEFNKIKYKISKELNNDIKYNFNILYNYIEKIKFIQEILNYENNSKNLREKKMVVFYGNAYLDYNNIIDDMIIFYNYIYDFLLNIVFKEDLFMALDDYHNELCKKIKNNVNIEYNIQTKYESIPEMIFNINVNNLEIKNKSSPNIENMELQEDINVYEDNNIKLDNEEINDKNHDKVCLDNGIEDNDFDEKKDEKDELKYEESDEKTSGDEINYLGNKSPKEKSSPKNKKNYYNLEKAVELFNETIMFTYDINNEIENITSNIYNNNYENIVFYYNLYKYIEKDEYLDHINKIYNKDTDNKKKKLKTKIIRCYNFICSIENNNINRCAMTPSFLAKMKTGDFKNFIKYIKEL